MKPYQSLSDHELISLLSIGDKGAFAQIFTRYHSVLFSHAYNKLRAHDDANDIIQDVFIKLWNHQDRIGSVDNLPGYLFTLTRNAVFSHLAHKKVVTSFAESYHLFANGFTEKTDHLIREKQFAEIINKEIAALPPRMREVFELSRKQKLPNKDIAVLLNISESTVADQIKKALRILRSRLGEALFMFYIFFNW